MRLLCLGDLGFSTEGRDGQEWDPPVGLIPGGCSRILLNWEIPLGEGVNPVPRQRGPRLHAGPEAAGVIRRWAPGFIALSNNHVMDAKEAGLSLTMEAFREMGFFCLGAGMSSERIASPLLWETADGALGIVNWTFAETHPEWMAVPGPNCWPGEDEATRVITTLKRSVDWVLVFAHWSDELCPYPQPKDRAIARTLVRAGASLIIAHHPHVVRGMEMVGRCPVFYSLGNYYFSGFSGKAQLPYLKSAPRNRESIGVDINLRRGEEMDLRLHSFWQEGARVITDPRRHGERRLCRAGRPLRMDLHAYRKWYDVARPRFARWGYRLYFRLPQMGWRGAMRYVYRAARKGGRG